MLMSNLKQKDLYLQCFMKWTSYKDKKHS